MPESKNLTIRIHKIHLLLKKATRLKKSPFGQNELLEELNNSLDQDGLSTISKRQLSKDIEFMRSDFSDAGYNAPITYSKKEKRYYYTKLNYELSSTSLVDKDFVLLQQAISLLTEIKGLNISDELQLFLQRVGLDSHKNIGKKALNFEQTSLKGIEWLQPVYEAIMQQQPIQVSYQPFHYDEPVHFPIHPYHLRQYNQRWFLFAQSHEKQQLVNFALDRIKKVELVDGIDYRPSRYDFNTMFEHVVGVSIPPNVDEPEDIVLHASLKRAPYILSKPIHASQQAIKATKEGVLISLKLFINPELKSLLLSFGKDITVLSPLALAEEMKKLVETSLENYDKLTQENDSNRH